MDINQQKEQFSITYIRAIAAVAGYSLYRPEIDNDSVDLGILSRGGTGKIFSPRIVLTGFHYAGCQIPQIQQMLLLKYLVVISLRQMYCKPSFNALVLEICHETYYQR